MQKKKRKDCYYGLHFDFHAVASVSGIGSFTSAEKVGAFLDAAKPDFVQIDTKGHPGYSSYLTECGSMAPGLVCDHLKIIREETAKRGILLYAHHSGIWDDAAGREHPEWNVIDENGNPVLGRMDVSSAYADERLIPQLKELALQYGLDGAWVDGDCWAYGESFSPAMLAEYQRRTGCAEVDRRLDSPSRLAYRQYCRDRFFEYVDHYVAEVKAACPDFEITSNLAYSYLSPHEVGAGIDYLSCDTRNLCEVRAAARCFAAQRRPWDVMAWSAPACTKSPEGGFYPVGTRHLSRFLRNGASAVAMGGAYEIVNAMTDQGEIRMLDQNKMKALSEFLRERKPFCFQSVPSVNAAILLEHEDVAAYRPQFPYNHAHAFTERDAYVLLQPESQTSERNKPGRSIERALCDVVIDGGRPVDIVYGHHVLRGDLSGRKTIIVPDNRCLSGELLAALKKFVKTGGNLIVSGFDTCLTFADLVPELKMEPYAGSYAFVSDFDAPDECAAVSRALSFTGEAEELCITYTGKMDFDAPKIRSAVKVPCGAGNLFLIGWDLFTEYTYRHYFVLRDIMRRVLDQAEPEPVAYLEAGPKRVEIIPAQKDGKLLVNVINTSEFYYDHDLGYAFDGFPSVENVTVAIRCEKEPRQVMLEPQHAVPEYRYDGKYLHVKLERVEVHTIVTVE